MTDPRLAPIYDFLEARHPDLGTIDPDMDLVESRVIDSLAFVEFILLIEEVTEAEIDVEEVAVDDLRTIRGVAKTFFDIELGGASP